MINEMRRMEVLDKMISLAKGAEHKEAEDLSEEERIAIAAFAGCDMVYEQDRDDPEIILITTVRPIGIQKVDGTFIVCVGPKDKMH